jgi:alkanesulfonate monooxygenase SsuD/methylene tetrahydromethanopterin reductase-like flavin-dependent oxidoreductase (luciferase family)
MEKSDDLLSQATDQFRGQAMAKDRVEKAQAQRDQTIARDHTAEAAAFTEEIIRWLNNEWNAREFTPEQRIFSVALATVNLRQHFPADKGGTACFDTVAQNAKQYYLDNANR